jgi:hypothetical protein
VLNTRKFTSSIMYDDEALNFFTNQNSQRRFSTGVYIATLTYHFGSTGKPNKKEKKQQDQQDQDTNPDEQNPAGNTGGGGGGQTGGGGVGGQALQKAQ